MSSADEHAPLLGQPGDVTQKPGQGLQYNFVTGTAIIAQAGVWILAALVWAAVFEHNVIFFSLHPLLNSAAIVLIVQGMLVLQPTAQQKDKIQGTYVHAIFNFAGTACLIAALVIIEMNKASHPETRFQSVHGKMGLIAFILIILQYIVGVLQFFAPELVFGSVDRAKSIYKYHRMFGYVLLVFFLATVCAATQTYYNKNFLFIRLWAVLVACVLIIAGVGARIKKFKFGF